MNVDEAGSRHDVLDLGAAEALRQVAQQRDLASRVRAANRRGRLRRRRDEPAVDVVQQRLPEAGAGGDQRDVAAAQRLRPPAARAARRVSTGTAYAIACRSFSSATRVECRTRRATSTARPTRQGTLVSSAASPSTGPATPKHAASIVRCRVAASREERRRSSRGRSAIVERGERRARPIGARPRGARLEQTEQRLGAADVASEQHHASS